MTSMQRYKGTVVHADEMKDWGFIGLASITHVDGSEVDPDELGGQDVYIHHREAKATNEISIGHEFTFSIETDRDREGAYRAHSALPVVGQPLEGGVELHMEQIAIDHPVVPIRWCLKPEAYEEMKRLPDDDWCIAIVAQKVGYYGKPAVIQKHIGLSKIKHGQGFLSFPSSDEFAVAVYLYRTNDDLKAAKRDYPEGANPSRYNIWKDEERHVLETDVDDLCFLGDATLAAYSVVMVEVPEGIFAKPMPQWKASWLSWFGLARPSDECAGTRRQIFAFTLGIPVYVIVEIILKRGYMLLLGLGHFLFGGSPFPVWKRATTTKQLSAYISNPVAQFEFERLSDFAGWKKLLHPALWVIVLVAVVALLIFPSARALTVSVAGVVVSVAVVIAVCAANADAFESYVNKKKAKRQREQEEADAFARQALLRELSQGVICGVEPTDKPRTFQLIYTGAKRLVCRPYGK